MFFDRDGVINEVVIRENGLVSSPRSLNEFKFKQDFLEFLPILKNLNLKTFVVSNQPDVGRNLMNINDLNEINKLILNEYKFTEIICCTDSENSSPDKKPNPGMIITLINKYNLIPEESLMIGDMWKDIEAAKRSGLTSVFLENSHSVLNNSVPDFKINNLNELLTILK